jgi:hypothetical protein
MSESETSEARGGAGGTMEIQKLLVARVAVYESYRLGFCDINGDCSSKMNMGI